MNKTVQSIISLIPFSIILIIITLFCGGLGFGRLFRISGIMEYCFLSMLTVIDILVIYKVYKLYITQPKVIILWLGLECCSILLWLAFICIDQSLLEWKGIEYACGLMWYYLSFYWDWVFIHRIGNYKQISSKERVIYKLKKK